MQVKHPSVRLFGLNIPGAALMSPTLTGGLEGVAEVFEKVRGH